MFKEMDFMPARHSSTQSLPINRTNCSISVFSVFLTFSISDTHSNIQYAKTPGKRKKNKKLWEDKKQNKEKGEHSDQMNNLVGHTF